MKITIDTKKDSVEEIEKVIALVREIMGVSRNESNTSNDFSIPESGVMGMFESNNLEQSIEKKKDDDPGIITY